ncbi:MAG: ferredoxin [Streptosporangiales bacterium]|nr:ferredoxin [Streptosporangiales bacterium]
MEVVVDRDQCEANGVCESLVPEVFQLDDEDVLRIRRPEPPPELVDRVRHAVRSCPKAALELRE